MKIIFVHFQRARKCFEHDSAGVVECFEDLFVGGLELRQFGRPNIFWEMFEEAVLGRQLPPDMPKFFEIGKFGAFRMLFAKRGVAALDFGAAFQLIVGTSTGAIIGCALATGIPPARIVTLYRDHGKAIFPRKLPDRVGLSLLVDFFRRKKDLRAGDHALRDALAECFGTTTLKDVYEQRGIAHRL